MPYTNIAKPTGTSYTNLNKPTNSTYTNLSKPTGEVSIIKGMAMGVLGLTYGIDRNAGNYNYISKPQ